MYVCKKTKKKDVRSNYRDSYYRESKYLDKSEVSAITLPLRQFLRDNIAWIWENAHTDTGRNSRVDYGKAMKQSFQL